LKECVNLAAFLKHDFMRCFHCIHFFKKGSRLDCTEHEKHRYIPKKQMIFEVQYSNQGGKNAKKKTTEKAP